MRENYDFSKSTPSPHAKQKKKQVTIRLDEDTINYFKSMSEEKAFHTRALPICAYQIAHPGTKS